MSDFLPVTPREVAARGWDAVDFVCVTGDAYVDHPSFGLAIISRLLERLGYRVAILAQPNWNDSNAFRRFGRPKYAFMITGGNIDSMVANYTAAKRRRNGDAYSPADGSSSRPDRAATVYSRAAKAAFPDCPVILGGIEASLRRFAHYDYWSDQVMPSVLVDSGADMISYGMGEKQTEQLARRLASGEAIERITDLRGTVCYALPGDIPAGAVSCASFEKVAASKDAYVRAFRQQLDEQDAVRGHAVVQKHGDRLVLQNPPMPILSREELDAVFTLPFARAYHPMYESHGGVKAIEEVEFSIMHNRGCFGHCNFCSIAVHQGRQVVSRSI
ncbi:MAG: YgiQ family radical SAM protein, partial [Oscillospiraceae bacterium]